MAMAMLMPILIGTFWYFFSKWFIPIQLVPIFPFLIQEEACITHLILRIDCLGLRDRATRTFTTNILCEQIPWKTEKNQYFYVRCTEFCVSIQKFDGFLDIFGYSQLISEPISKILGVCPPQNFGYWLRNQLGVSKNPSNFWILTQKWMHRIQKY